MALRILSFLVLIPFLLSAQKDLTVHEWGTFTTLATPSGELLNGLTRVEEPVPHFVYSLSTHFKPYEKAILDAHTEIINVNSRMETPVIYFYTNEKIDFKISVGFKGGAITEWYPARSGGESLSDTGRPGFHAIYENSYYEVDLSDGYVGNIKWNGSVNPGLSDAKLTFPDSASSPQWITPRITNSNHVQNNKGEVEKYLFYRGLANLEPPVKVAFNTEHNLVISNTSPEKVPYVFVYENSGSTSRVLWQGKVPGEFAEVVKFDQELCYECLEEKKVDFAQALKQAGLYEDEAWALLNTWKKSYFNTKGIKVFWIMPKSYVNEILPISISPKPDELERVFVGRSEIISPEKLASITEMSNKLLEKYYGNDRFYHCYKNAKKGEERGLSNILKDTFLNPLKRWELKIYPNPASNEITIVKPDFDLQNATIQIVDVNGKMHLKEAITFDFSQWSIDIQPLRPGVYQLILKNGDEMASTSFIKQ